MTREDAVAKLMEELEKGWRSGEEEGWLSLEEVREHFALKSFNDKTETAMLEAEQIAGDKSVKGYTEMTELIAALKE